MKILTIDIGTGTQDIFLYDSRLDLENGFKMIMPSPTMIVHNRIRKATQKRKNVVLSGSTMGGGPSAWAAEAHVRAGLTLYATPDAALSFNDDLEKVKAIGIKIVGEEEVNQKGEDTIHIHMADFDSNVILNAFRQFGVSLDDLDGLALAVFDHGASPLNVSDRRFRFDYLAEQIKKSPTLSTFAFRTADIPTCMTRMKAIASSAEAFGVPVIVMDTAPAAILGASFDTKVKSRNEWVGANIGNFHTLAFRFRDGVIEGLFEHHTGALTADRLEGYLLALASGLLTFDDIFEDEGHGALIYSTEPCHFTPEQFNLFITGPRRSLLRESALRPYFAVPFGDMMISGCFGLLAAAGERMPQWNEQIRDSLINFKSSPPAPWDID